MSPRIFLYQRIYFLKGNRFFLCCRFLQLPSSSVSKKPVCKVDPEGCYSRVNLPAIGKEDLRRVWMKKEGKKIDQSVGWQSTTLFFSILPFGLFLLSFLSLSSGPFTSPRLNFFPFAIFLHSCSLEDIYVFLSFFSQRCPRKTRLTGSTKVECSTKLISEPSCPPVLCKNGATGRGKVFKRVHQSS